jgi:hypothetical protein
MHLPGWCEPCCLLYMLQALAATAYMLLALFQPWRLLSGLPSLDTSSATVSIIIPVRRFLSPEGFFPQHIASLCMVTAAAGLCHYVRTCIMLSCSQVLDTMCLLSAWSNCCVIFALCWPEMRTGSGVAPAGDEACVKPGLPLSVAAKSSVLVLVLR